MGGELPVSTDKQTNWQNRRTSDFPSEPILTADYRRPPPFHINQIEEASCPNFQLPIRSPPIHSPPHEQLWKPYTKGSQPGEGLFSNDDVSSSTSFLDYPQQAQVADRPSRARQRQGGNKGKHKQGIRAARNSHALLQDLDRSSTGVRINNPYMFQGEHLDQGESSDQSSQIAPPHRSRSASGRQSQPLLKQQRLELHEPPKMLSVSNMANAIPNVSNPSLAQPKAYGRRTTPV